MATKFKSVAVARRIPREARPRVRSYAASVGEVVWAANYCMTAFNLMFRRLFAPDDAVVAIDLWHSQRMDKNQVDLLRAALKGQTRVDFELRRRILWAASRHERLAEHRNDAVHSAIQVRGSLKPSEIATHPERVKRLLAQPNLKRFWGVLRNDLFQLGNYVHILWQYHFAGGPGTHPLPKKPRLRSVTNPRLPSKKDLGLTL